MKDLHMELRGCASNLLAHENLEHLRKLIIDICKSSSNNVKISLVYENENNGDSLYEIHGATLKHKCGKRIVVCPLSLFSLFLYSLTDLVPSFSRNHKSPLIYFLIGRGTL